MNKDYHVLSFVFVMLFFVFGIDETAAFTARIGTTNIVVEYGNIVSPDNVRDAVIVDAANPCYAQGGGVDRAIRAAAGEAALDAEVRARFPFFTAEQMRDVPIWNKHSREEIDAAYARGAAEEEIKVLEKGCARANYGEANLFCAYNLERYGCLGIILVAGPNMTDLRRLGRAAEGPLLLRDTYKNSLNVANGVARRIAFPSISTDHFGFSLYAETLQDGTVIRGAVVTAVNAVIDFIMEHPGAFDEVKWVIYDESRLAPQERSPQKVQQRFNPFAAAIKQRFGTGDQSSHTSSKDTMDAYIKALKAFGAEIIEE